MGELIGTATTDKDGLLRKVNSINEYKTTSGVNRYLEITIQSKYTTVGFIVQLYYSGINITIIINQTQAIMFGGTGGVAYGKDNKLYIGVEWTNQHPIEFTLQSIGEALYTVGYTDTIPDGANNIGHQITT